MSWRLRVQKQTNKQNKALDVCSTKTTLNMKEGKRRNGMALRFKSTVRKGNRDKNEIEQEWRRQRKQCERLRRPAKRPEDVDNETTYKSNRRVTTALQEHEITENQTKRSKSCDQEIGKILQKISTHARCCNNKQQRRKADRLEKRTGRGCPDNKRNTLARKAHCKAKRETTELELSSSIWLTDNKKWQQPYTQTRQLWWRVRCEIQQQLRSESGNDRQQTAEQNIQTGKCDDNYGSWTNKQTNIAIGAFTKPCATIWTWKRKGKAWRFKNCNWPEDKAIKQQRSETARSNNSELDYRDQQQNKRAQALTDNRINLKAKKQPSCTDEKLQITHNIKKHRHK